jgi:predicted O-methyltransferase YrrM
MNLKESLALISAQIHADANELWEYAQEDTLGGYHWDASQATFKQGSCFGVEGQTLYALVRHLKPEKVVEIGGWAGCSGSHLAAAVIKNGKGHVYSIDNEVGGQQHGADMPAAYRKVSTLVRANGQDWLAQQPPNSIGFVFEDADHSTGLTFLLSHLALVALEPGGILANHDAGHDFAYDGYGRISQTSTVGREVRDGLAQANAYFKVYRAEPSDCGLAITLKPGKRPEIGKVDIDEDVRKGFFKDAPRAAEPDAELDPIVEVNGAPVSNAHIESESTPPPAKKPAEEDTKPTPKAPAKKRTPAKKAAKSKSDKSENMDMKLLAPLPPGLRGGHG